MDNSRLLRVGRLLVTGASPSSAVLFLPADCLEQCGIIIVTDDNDYRSKADLTGDVVR